MLATFLLAVSLCHPIEVRPPRIATCGGITVGLTTVEAFEKRFGQGLVSVGGHSNGARSWYDLRYGALVRVDGFDFADDGEVVDQLDVDWLRRDRVSPKVPSIRTRRVQPGLLAHLHPGMSRADAAKALVIAGGSDSVVSTGVVRYSSDLVNKDNDRFTTWTLNLSFGPHGLESFSVSAN